MRYDASINSFWDGEKKITLFRIAIPKFLELILVTVIGTVNTLMLSGYNEAAVAATGVANTVVNLAFNLCTMACVGTSVVMSTELGKGNRSEAAKIAGTGFLVTMIVALLSGGGIGIFAEGLMGLMDLESEACAIAAGYLRIKGWFLFVSALGSFFNTLLICTGRALFAMISGITSNILNVLFGYIVLYSSLPLPFGAADGIAAASILAQTGGLAVAAIAYFSLKRPFRLSLRWRDAFRILRIGVPASMANLSFSLATFVSTRFITGLGTAAINAKIYVTDITNYTSRVSFALSQGTGVLMGRFRGSGRFDAIKRLYWQNTVLAVTANASLSLLVLILCRPLLSLFTASDEIIALGALLLAIDILVEIGRAVNHVSEQSLNANGDALICLTTSVSACWLCSILLGFLLSVTARLGVFGIWIAYAANELLKAIIYLFRWKSGKWRTKAV